jgi:hypothetical protein
MEPYRVNHDLRHDCDDDESVFVLDQHIVYHAMTLAVESQQEALLASKEILQALEAGEKVPMFAPGEAGVNAARMLVQTHQDTIYRLVTVWDLVGMASTVAVVAPSDLIDDD